MSDIRIEDKGTYIQWYGAGVFEMSCRAYWQEGVVGSLMTSGDKNKIINKNLRIRRLTPKECFRLMGVKDSDYDRIKRGQSDTSLYHMAGDAIVSTIPMAIFGSLLGGDFQNKYKGWDYKS